MVENDVLEALRNAGLNDKEATVYLDLINHGESRTGIICKRTKIPSSHIYKILGTLIEKGIINYKIINNIKVFRASNPQSIKNLYEKKVEEITNNKEMILETIKKLSKTIPKQERPSDYKYFEGINGIKSMYEEFMTLWEEGDEYCVVSAKESYEKLEQYFIQIVHKKRIKEKVRMKIIITNESKEYINQWKKMKLTEIKASNMKTATEYLILKDHILLINYGKKPYGLMIKDKSFAETFKEYFQVLWKQAKK